MASVDGRVHRLTRSIPERVELARRLPGHPTEHAREGGRAVVADLRRDTLVRLALGEKLARDRHAPDRQVLNGRQADQRPKMIGEPRP